MWLLGTAFIAASAAVYFMFMAAWLNLIILLGFMVWVRIALGLLALLAAATAWKNTSRIKTTLARLKKATTKQKNF